MFIVMSEMCKSLCQIRRILSEENTVERGEWGVPDWYCAAAVTVNKFPAVHTAAPATVPVQPKKDALCCIIRFDNE